MAHIFPYKDLVLPCDELQCVLSSLLCLSLFFPDLISFPLQTETLSHLLAFLLGVSLGICVVDRPHGGTCRKLPGPLRHRHGCRSGDPVP